jgi:hypothetical protein
VEANRKKFVKMLGLAMVAALALTAVAGAGTASARRVVICSVNLTPCRAGNVLPAGTESTGKLLARKSAG